MMTPPDAPLVSVVIPNLNGAACLKECLVSLKRQTYTRFEILVVDNNSSDDSVETAHRIAPDAVVLRQEKNLGFAGGVNAGIRAAKGDWIALLNNDAVAAEDWIYELISAAGRYVDASFLASRIVQFDDVRSIYSAGDCFLRAGVGYRRGQELEDRPEYHQPCEVFSACGCAALYRKEIFPELGGFDEHFFAYLEDVELGLRLRAAGRRGYYVPRAVVRHHGGVTTGGEFSPLAVRLRTRNSLLLLIKSLPAGIVARCLPMIALSQACWFGRVVTHGRLLSYTRGVLEVFPAIPAMLRERRGLRCLWRKNFQRLWESILESESLASLDFQTSRAANASSFLNWYFHKFAYSRSGKTGAGSRDGSSPVDPL